MSKASRYRPLMIFISVPIFNTTHSAASLRWWIHRAYRTGFRSRVYGLLAPRVKTAAESIMLSRRLIKLPKLSHRQDHPSFLENQNNSRAQKSRSSQYIQYYLILILPRFYLYVACAGWACGVGASLAHSRRYPQIHHLQKSLSSVYPLF